ncbi:FMN-binding negative transcriptional regulator, partial [Rhodobacteraceae bacterium]|nr:FMN-binding negative transcriptional regulator [Paracoccaceae bacterium]
MHPNPVFRKTDTRRSLDFARQTGFGHLMVVSDDMPLVSHIPFLIDEEQGEVELHLVRSNPMARLLKSGARPAKLAVIVPHGYISPDWYGVKDQVPTWNYVAVHLSGSLSLQPQENIRA